MTTNLDQLHPLMDDLKVNASRMLCTKRKYFIGIESSTIVDLPHMIDHDDEIPYLKKHKTLYGQKYTRVASTFFTSRFK